MKLEIPDHKKGGKPKAIFAVVCYEDGVRSVSKGKMSAEQLLYTVKALTDLAATLLSTILEHKKHHKDCEHYTEEESE